MTDLIPVMLTPCMGGWCRQRAACLHYTPGSAREPVERLCAAGIDEPLRAAPLRPAPTRVGA